MSDYLWKLIITAIICAIISSLSPKGAVKLVSAAAAGCAILAALLNFPAIGADFKIAAVETPDYSRIGREEINAVIAEKTSAYIEEKARSFGESVRAVTLLNDDGTPRGVLLSGAGNAPLTERWIIDELRLQVGYLG